jgi:hypothetical protein
MYTEKEKDIRSRENVRDKGEVFTPFAIVEKMLELVPEDAWKDPEYVFLEPTCGNGQFLVKILEKRLSVGIPLETALNTIIGMDISSENILESHQRLYEICALEMDKMKLTKKQLEKFCVRLIVIVTNNIFQTDALKALQEYKMGKGILYKLRHVYVDPSGGKCFTKDEQKTQEELKEKFLKSNYKQAKKMFAPFKERL